MIKPYYAVLRLRLSNGLQYRAAAYAGIGTQFFSALFSLWCLKLFMPRLVQPHRR